MLVVALGGFALVAPPAAAATCTHDPATFTVAVAVGDAESVTIARSGDAITHSGAPCETATVSNTDTIAVTATGTPASIAIDLGGGGFLPGATAEAEGDSEIEFTIALPSGSPTLRVIGTANVDEVVAGANGINLNAAEEPGDPDVTITGTIALVLDGGDANDVLSVGGGAGTGAAGPSGSVLGGAGDDVLGGGAGGSTLDGGDGLDAADYTGATQLTRADLGAGTVQHQGEGTDTLVAIENLTGSPGDDTILGDAGDNVLDGGEGRDTLDFGAATTSIEVDLLREQSVGVDNDTVVGFEDVIGSPQNDVIVGNGEANHLDGGTGDDTIDGAGGDDDLAGGVDDDTVSFATSNKSVTVDLRKGTAEGDGADTLAGFENVFGSRRGDEISGDSGKNRLDGLGGPDIVSGGKDADVLLGGTGKDLLFGQKGNDLILGGPGKDQLDGGEGEDRCKGGPDPDAFVLCENFPT